MGVACASLPWGGKEEGSWGESVALAQTQSQAPMGPFLGNIWLISYELSRVCRPWLFGRSKRCFRAEMLEEVMNLWLCSWWSRISSSLSAPSNHQFPLFFGKQGGRVEVMTWRPWKLKVYWDLQVDLRSVSMRTTGSAYLVVIFVHLRRHRNGCSPVTRPVSFLLDSGWHFLSLPLQIYTESYLWTSWFLQFNLSKTDLQPHFPCSADLLVSSVAFLISERAFCFLFSLESAWLQGIPIPSCSPSFSDAEMPAAWSCFSILSSRTVFIPPSKLISIKP